MPPKLFTGFGGSINDITIVITSYSIHYTKLYDVLADDDRLLSLNDPMAPFLETREYAKQMGASAEFRKMEGVAYDEKHSKLYIAMSSIDT